MYVNDYLSQKDEPKTVHLFLVSEYSPCLLERIVGICCTWLRPKRGLRQTLQQTQPET